MEGGAVPSGSIVMIENTSSIGTDWKVCNGQAGTPDMRDVFVLGSGGSVSSPNETTDGTGGTTNTFGGYEDACALGHFHGGMTFSIYSGPMNRGGIFGISESFDHGGGDCGSDIISGVSYGGDLMSKIQGYPNLSQTPSGSSDNGNCGSVILNLGENVTNAHKHQLHTWGELYDNYTYIPPSSDELPTVANGYSPGWQNIGGDNVPADGATGRNKSNPDGRNLPPYIKLHFIKFAA